MLFDMVIDESLKDEIIVTVFATGFDEVVAHSPSPKAISRPSVSAPTQTTIKREPVREEVPVVEKNITSLDDLDIPTFLRNLKDANF